MNKQEIRQMPPSYNSRDLRIGQRVLVKAKATVDYVNETDKEVIRTPVSGHMEAFVVGVKKKALGKYRPGGMHSISLDGLEPDYEEPYLEVARYQWFYVCRCGLKSKSFLVHPEDLEVL